MAFGDDPISFERWTGAAGILGGVLLLAIMGTNVAGLTETPVGDVTQGLLPLTLVMVAMGVLGAAEQVTGPDGAYPWPGAALLSAAIAFAAYGSFTDTPWPWLYIGALGFAPAGLVALALHVRGAEVMPAWGRHLFTVTAALSVVGIAVSLLAWAGVSAATGGTDAFPTRMTTGVRVVAAAVALTVIVVGLVSVAPAEETSAEAVGDA